MTTADSSRSSEPAGGTSLGALDTFPRRHLGPDETATAEMLRTVGAGSLEELIAQTIPAGICLKKPLALPAGLSESEALAELRTLAEKNEVCKSFIGMGYYGTITPPVILRNILENPGWYTQYTPYQAEISQGRLEALLNFQTMVSDLTALPLANSSMLDEATAAAEAMHMCHSIHPDRGRFFVAQDCHPQTIAVVKSRAKWLGIDIVVDDPLALPGKARLDQCCGILVQYPTTDGRIVDYGPLTEAAHKAGTQVVAATDLLALTLIRPPGEWAGGGADIAVGSAQRFGVPMGFGGPHAAFMACKNEFTRKLPGRIVGVSKDVHGNPAYRLAIQTREQHIRREKATSNICTAQVLLAIMASMYAVYHGPEGLKAIANRVHSMTERLAGMLAAQGHEVVTESYFDTITVNWDISHLPRSPEERLVAWGGFYRNLLKFGYDAGINLAPVQSQGRKVKLSLDETATEADLIAISKVFGYAGDGVPNRHDTSSAINHPPQQSKIENRKSKILQHPVFNSYHSETEMLRYMKRLEGKDLSLTTSMIPLGSCTMKLNATSEMLPVTWPEFANMHPFAPADQTQGYQELFAGLEKWLAEITGFDAVSLQPNAGSQGEYAGLLAIRGYHESRGEKRDVCLIPNSAHGTNPASAVVAGLTVVPVECDDAGNIDVADLKQKAADHAKNLAAIMITYPSTHGVFEEQVREICGIVHANGGQVYMDGANMNAQVGLTSPGEIGADVCHLNLHKTFCIPHGGGGPGMGPIAVRRHLARFLPSHPLDVKAQGLQSLGLVGPVSAALRTGASILVIPWMYIRMMGEPGLRRASEIAILNANYMAKRLETHYPVLYRGKNGRCAHEFILDCRHFEESSGVKVEDIAKRLMDYGFHAPTMSWPVPGTLMFEPTESESRPELNRLCDAMILIREEIRTIETGIMDRTDNPLKNAPHTAAAVTADEWPHPYPRQAAFPAQWTKLHKFWPAAGRIDNPYGNRHLVCTCPPM